MIGTAFRFYIYFSSETVYRRYILNVPLYMMPQQDDTCTAFNALT